MTTRTTDTISLFCVTDDGEQHTRWRCIGVERIELGAHPSVTLYGQPSDIAFLLLPRLPHFTLELLDIQRGHPVEYDANKVICRMENFKLLKGWIPDPVPLSPERVNVVLMYVKLRCTLTLATGFGGKEDEGRTI